MIVAGLKKLMSVAGSGEMDWSSRKRSANTIKGDPHKFTIMFLHEWLLVGKLPSKYDPVQYPRECPLRDETFITFSSTLSQNAGIHSQRTSVRQRSESLNTDTAFHTATNDKTDKEAIPFLALILHSMNRLTHLGRAVVEATS
ncbi:hypothetical protein IV203_022487 [Nitzschia inconspicua]|uniref:Uncharacterized protein n=1 Tax=Nitzschia inconspicua TaxID=303405 RepID=A0A9K3K6S3_9STRA|nr:hypothetical protein IV203_022731 [Nitzschia inconspicua]KAG7344479.1 hypothetical protein IV203_022487 [Nitzschia inconspicua]